MKSTLLSAIVPMAGMVLQAQGIALDLTSVDSIKSVTSTLAYDMMTYYSGNLTGQTPGLLPGPCASTACYYWWEAGAMFGSLINYWQYTGDTSYNDVVSQALLFQVGPDENYNPPNQSKNMGVDDQVFWAFSALDAAEANFPNPPEGSPSWIALAQAVFNSQALLWDPYTCGGGMRWQEFSFNAGWNLKNTISNGGNFQLAARLARFTGNQSYADWANKMWDWMEASPLLLLDDNKYYVWDNTDTDNNCTTVDNLIWSYNYGTLIMGAASLYNFTNGSAIWQTRIEQLMAGAFTTLYPAQYGGSKIMVEACEPPSNCDNDQSSFKAYLCRWFAITSLLAPFTAAQILPTLQANAVGAAAQCIGGTSGRQCGRRWYQTTWDGTAGVGQQMSALSVIGSNLVTQAMVPLTKDTGATSKGNPNAGTQATSPTGVTYTAVTTGDRAGAAILTILVIIGVVGGSLWIII